MGALFFFNSWTSPTLTGYYTLVSPAVTPSQQAYITPKEAAQILNLHKNTVHRLTKNGTIPSVRMGRAVRIPLSWIYAQAEASGK